MVHRTEITQIQLRKGALLGTIAHAIWVVNHPDFAFEQSWEGDVYNVSDSMGALGSIAFSEKEAVGAFFDVEVAEDPVDPESVFKGMPVERDALKDEALQYMHQRVDGGSRPMATTGFWTERGQVVASEPWEEVHRKGAHLIRIQLLPPEQAYAAWKENYEFSEALVDLLKRIYDKRSRQDGIVTLDDEEMHQLTDRGDAGLTHALALLDSIGIRTSRDWP